MKKVFTNAYDVIHLFAQQTQDEARSSNIFFEYGTKIYSYGYHYLLGEFITNKQGEKAIMINDTGYSSTTSQHINSLRSATRQYKQFSELGTNPVMVLYQLEGLAQKLRSARKKELYTGPAERLFASFNEFHAWNGPHISLQTIAQINEIIEVFRGKDINQYLAEKAEIIKKAEIKAKKLALKKVKEDVKKFMAYEIDYIYNTPEDFIRISKDGSMIESSQRVKASVRIARELYRKILAKEDIKGFMIDNYTVIGLNGVLRIGCHKINTKNMHEIGQKLIS